MQGNEEEDVTNKIPVSEEKQVTRIPVRTVKSLETKNNGYDDDKDAKNREATKKNKLRAVKSLEVTKEEADEDNKAACFSPLRRLSFTLRPFLVKETYFCEHDETDKVGITTGCPVLYILHTLYVIISIVYKNFF